MTEKKQCHVFNLFLLHKPNDVVWCDHTSAVTTINSLIINVSKQ